ncbi:MAG: hypothetical protein ABII07_03335 [Patescibacteria group bacterium]|nr:hypothetical protein [Patescibacteria group bacterium]
MKKIIVSLIGVIITISFILLAGCNMEFFEKLSPIQYNNKVVESLNQTSETIENTILVYDISIPDLVTEESEIDTTDMETSYDLAKEIISNSASILELSSKDEAQQTEVRVEFQNYISLGEEYLAKYLAMIEYYKTGLYLEDLSLVTEHDTTIYDAYNTFIESNNTLVDILESYI